MTAATAEQPASTFTAAKRGDVVIVHETITSYALHSESSSFDSISLGIVTSVTREGLVKAWKPARDSSQPRKVPDRARTLLVPQASVCVPALLAMAATHNMSDLGYPSFYRTLDEVRADARHCRIPQCETWGAAHAAARFWAASEAANAAYAEGQAAAGRANRDAGYHTAEGRQAYDTLTREAMAEHTAAMLTAARQFRSVVPTT